MSYKLVIVVFGGAVAAAALGAPVVAVGGAIGLIGLSGLAFGSMLDFDELKAGGGQVAVAALLGSIAAQSLGGALRASWDANPHLGPILVGALGIVAALVCGGVLVNLAGAHAKHPGAPSTRRARVARRVEIIELERGPNRLPRQASSDDENDIFGGRHG